MRIISVDPGFERLGVAVLERDGNKESLIFSDCIRTDKNLDYNERLAEIGSAFLNVIKEYNPTILASESLFFAKNQKTAIDVAGVRGVLFYIAEKEGLSIFEYTPLQIKIAITGYGRSDKDQVTDMVKKLIKIEKEIKLDDEFDAIAVGLTCLASERF